MSDKRIGVLIIDDRAVIRRGLRNILTSDPDFAVLDEASSISEGLSLARGLSPDVAIIGLANPIDDFCNAANKLRTELSIPSLAFSTSDDWMLINGWLQAGGAGFLTLNAMESEIIRSAKRAANGDTFILCGVRQEQSAATPSPTPVLSGRESEIITLVAAGYSSTKIAEALRISTKTIETYRSRIARKLGLRTRFELVQYAIRNGMISSAIRKSE